jgi:ribonucleoside-diphosphate reductase alpha chain
VEDHAAALYHRMFGASARLPKSFVTVNDLTPVDHVAMQAAAQRWVDSGISKTVNCPEDISFEAFEQIYLDAYHQGCKGCTTYRPNDVTGSVLTA